MEITVSSMPDSFESFMAMPQSKLLSPEDTAFMFLVALNMFVKNEKIGLEALKFLKGPGGVSTYEVSFLKDRLYDKKYLPMAYFVGATPENNYTPNMPLVLNVIKDSLPPTEEGYVRVFLETVGADSKREIKLRKKDNQWFVWDYPAIVVGIRIPKNEDPWG